MITECFISTIHHYDEDKFPNGMNIKISRCQDSSEVNIEICCHSEEKILKCSIKWSDFKKTFKALYITGED